MQTMLPAFRFCSNLEGSQTGVFQNPSQKGVSIIHTVLYMNNTSVLEMVFFPRPFILSQIACVLPVPLQKRRHPRPEIK